MERKQKNKIKKIIITNKIEAVINKTYCRLPFLSNFHANHNATSIILAITVIIVIGLSFFVLAEIKLQTKCDFWKLEPLIILYPSKIGIKLKIVKMTQAVMQI